MNTKTLTNTNGSEVAMAKRLRLKSVAPKPSAEGKKKFDRVYDTRADRRTVERYEDNPAGVDLLDLRAWARYVLDALEWGDDELLDSPMRTFFDVVDD